MKTRIFLLACCLLLLITCLFFGTVCTKGLTISGKTMKIDRHGCYVEYYQEITEDWPTDEGFVKKTFKGQRIDVLIKF